MQTSTPGRAVFAPVWAALLAALLLIGLLLAYDAVLRQAIRQGEQRRVAAAAQLDGQWRCRTLRGRSAVDGCLRQLAAAASTDATSSVVLVGH
ncbi:MAG TPA: hypothetical protein VLI72_07995 [Methylibium sp.]|nr:hypothetical protein [Methylibium sp.]